MADPTNNAKNKIKKMRSPNYPCVDLEGAIAKARDLFPKIGKHPAAPGDVMKELGYTTKSSTGLGLVGALSSFGLLDAVGRGADRRLTLSNAALRIIHDPEESTARKAALTEAAIKPAAHKLLWDKFGNELPPSDQVIRSYLIVESGFTEDAATQLIGEYRATFKTANLDKSPPVVNNNGTEGEPTDLSQKKVVVGEWVQWTSQGAAQFEKPLRVSGFSPDGQYAFFEGKQAGVLASELTVEKPLESAKPMQTPPPLNPNFVPPASAGVPVSILMGKGAAQVITIPKMTTKAFKFFKSQLDAFAEAIVDDGAGDDGKSSQ